MGSFSIWHWLIVLLVVVLIFGTKKLRNIGGDVGGAVKSFKDAMNEGKSGLDTPADSQDALLNKRAETNLIAANVVEAPAVKTAAKKKTAVTKKPAATKSAAAKPKAATKTAVAKPKVAAVKKTNPQ